MVQRSTHTEIWPREQISPDQNTTPFPLLVPISLTAVLINVAPMSENPAIGKREKAFVMTTDRW